MLAFYIPVNWFRSALGVSRPSINSRILYSYSGDSVGHNSLKFELTGVEKRKEKNWIDIAVKGDKGLSTRS